MPDEPKSKLVQIRVKGVETRLGYIFSAQTTTHERSDDELKSEACRSKAEAIGSLILEDPGLFGIEIV